jgi:hypothetical protein
MATITGVHRRRRFLFGCVALTLVLGIPSVSLAALWGRAVRKLDAVSSFPSMEDAPFENIRRPSLFGDPLPGNAWDYYEKTAETIFTTEGAVNRLSGIGRQDFPPSLPLILLVELHRDWLDSVFKGLRCIALRRSKNPRLTSDVNTLQSFLLAAAEVERGFGRDAEALRILCAALAVAGDFRRRVDPHSFTEGLGIEMAAAAQWRLILSQHALTGGELEKACRLLDRIEEIRPTLLDAARLQFQSDRTELVAYYPGSVRPGAETPGWRHLGMWTFKLSEMVNQIDEDFQSLLDLERLPWHLRKGEWAMMEDARERGRMLGSRRWGDYYGGLPLKSSQYEKVTYVRRFTELVRVASAVAWYEVEKQRFPDRLEDLVPRYLPQVPICPHTGMPFAYSEGRIEFEEEHWNGSNLETVRADWVVQRR